MIPTVRKAALTEALQALTRKILEEQKKAAAANKEKAVAAAVAAADAAAEAGAKFLVSKLDVGLDAKAIQVQARGEPLLLLLCCCWQPTQCMRQGTTEASGGARRGNGRYPGWTWDKACSAAGTVHSHAALLRLAFRPQALPPSRSSRKHRTHPSTHRHPPHPNPSRTPHHTTLLPPWPLRLPQEAWNAIQKKHAALPVLFVSAGEDKAMAYAGVPQDLSKQLPAGACQRRAPHWPPREGWTGTRAGANLDACACVRLCRASCRLAACASLDCLCFTPCVCLCAPAGEWVKEALTALGGKGGGKPTNAQVGRRSVRGPPCRRGPLVARLPGPLRAPQPGLPPGHRHASSHRPSRPAHPLPHAPQGTGPEVGKVDEALALATSFASVKL